MILNFNFKLIHINIFRFLCMVFDTKKNIFTQFKKLHTLNIFEINLNDFEYYAQNYFENIK